MLKQWDTTGSTWATTRPTKKFSAALVTLRFFPITKKILSHFVEFLGSATGDKLLYGEQTSEYCLLEQ